MSTDPFAHLHVASGYSLRYGAATPDVLVRRAAQLGQGALALTDRDGLYGAVRFVLACRQAGVAPVLGVDIAVRESGLLPRWDAGPKSTRRTPARGGVQVDPLLPRVVLLARGQQGWASLCRLVSAVHLEGDRGKPIATLKQIAEHSSGLVLLLGPASEVGRAVTARRFDLAAAVSDQWREVFEVSANPAESQLVIEVVSHMVPDVGSSMAFGHADRSAAWVAGMSVAAAARLYGWAGERQLPRIITNAVRHTTADQAKVVDVLDAIRRLVPVSGRHLERGNAEGYLKSGEAMWMIAEQVTAAAGVGNSNQAAARLLRDTSELAQSCVIDPVADMGLGSTHVPELDVVLTGSSYRKTSSVAEAAVADEILRSRCLDAMARRGYRGKEAKVADKRLEEELRTISQLGFGGYFLTVAEVVDLIKEMGVRVAARGSGAGSLVNHMLGISGVDPMQHGLLMERFLSPLRQSLPDIDVDVESHRRTEVYEEILNRFGGDRCTCVSMMDTYRVRHAVRDVGAALGMPPGEIDTFAKAFPHIRARDARAALVDLPELRSSGLGKLAADGRLDTFLTLVESLDGLPRHIALHPCGVLLSDSGLLDRTPVEASWLGFPMSQFDKDDVEEMGFLKLDVLGIRMQSAMAHAVAEIGRVASSDRSESADPAPEDSSGGNPDLDIDAIALDDEATFELIKSARTLGCFQIESPGQRELVGKFSPETFDDLIVDISLFRPGPVKSDMITPFLRARHGWSQPEYLLEALRPILAETSGVVVFHEQVIRIVSALTGCSLARSDEVRRTLGTPEGQQEVRTWFYPTAMKRGFTLAEVERVWDVLKAFASFGFCKAHAAAFALPTYQSAWLKTHHPAAFFAGILTHDPGMYPKRLILDDARNSGIGVLGLDVNRSDRVYRVELEPGREPSIRIPLAEVKGVSDAEEVSIIAGRPYESLSDFWQRSAVSRPTSERLILAGGFDELHRIGQQAQRGGITRRDLLLQVGDLDRYSRSLSGGRGNRAASRRRPVVNDPGIPGVPIDSAVAARRQSQAPAPVCDPTELTTQMAFDLADAPGAVTVSGLSEMTDGEQVRAEVEILGMDVTVHMVSFYEDMLNDLAVVRSKDLLDCRSQAEVLVAGVKVATQTPPVRGGKRVIFLTLDDSTGPVDATFFEASQALYANTLFQSWLLLVRGHVRRTGRRGISLRATGCWDLGEIRQVWSEGGRVAVRALLDEESLTSQVVQDPRGAEGGQNPREEEQARQSADTPDISRVGGRSKAGGMGQRRRVLVHASGFRMSPYSDIKPAGEDIKKPRPTKKKPTEPPTKLWHSSQGSSGW
jgi:error-prone DNA polymerase